MIMSVHAAPNAPPRLIQDLFLLIRCVPSENKLIMGDFNRNIQDHRAFSKMSSTGTAAGLSLRYLQNPTKRAATQIDIIFSNFDHISGTYASLTSFYSPIWVGIGQSHLELNLARLILP